MDRNTVEFNERFLKLNLCQKLNMILMFWPVYVIINCPSCLKCRLWQCGGGTGFVKHFLPRMLGFQTPPQRFHGVCSSHFSSSPMKCYTEGIDTGRIWKKGMLWGRISWFFVLSSELSCGSSIPSGVKMGSAGFSLKMSNKAVFCSQPTCRWTSGVFFS